MITNCQDVHTEGHKRANAAKEGKESKLLIKMIGFMIWVDKLNRIAAHTIMRPNDAQPFCREEITWSGGGHCRLLYSTWDYPKPYYVDGTS